MMDLGYTIRKYKRTKAAKLEAKNPHGSLIFRKTKTINPSDNHSFLLNKLRNVHTDS